MTELYNDSFTKVARNLKDTALPPGKDLGRALLSTVMTIRGFNKEPEMLNRVT